MGNTLTIIKNTEKIKITCYRCAKCGRAVRLESDLKYRHDTELCSSCRKYGKYLN